MLTELIKRAFQVEQEFVKNLTQAQRRQTGRADNWSAKDLVAHNAAWKQRHSENIRAVLRGEEATRVEDYDSENEKLFLAHREKTWEEVLADAAQVQQALLGLVQELPAQTLEKYGYFAWQTDRPLWRTIYGYGYSHPLVHLAEHHRNRGDRQAAAGMIKLLVDAMQSLQAEPFWQGGLNYNLACYHALSDRPEEAIAELSTALGLNPEFKAWARQDPDLESLRMHPGYLALVEEAA